MGVPKLKPPSQSQDPKRSSSNTNWLKLLRDIGGSIRQSILDPQQYWDDVSLQKKTRRELFEQYIYILAGIPAVCGFGSKVIFSGGSDLEALAYALIGYLLSVTVVYIACIIAQRTAPIFDGSLTSDEASKLVVFSSLPFFISGIFLLFPFGASLSLLGFYSVYLFHIGIKSLSRIPEAKQMTYLMLNIVAWLLVAMLMVEVLSLGI